MSSRFTAGTRAALIALSKGTCYWPNCSEPVVRFVDKTPVFNVHFAHIYAANPGGPRYDPDMSEEERQSFANVILLCHPHHSFVDLHHPEQFPPGRLKELKDDREGEGRKEIERIGSVSEQRLQSLIVEALNDRNNAIASAVDLLRQVNGEAATLLDQMMEELGALRRSPMLLVDPDVAEGLMTAAGTLSRHLHADNVETLLLASGDLRGLQGVVDGLQEATEKLGRHVNQDTVQTLYLASRQLNGLQGLAESLQETAGELGRHVDQDTVQTLYLASKQLRGLQGLAESLQGTAGELGRHLDQDTVQMLYLASKQLRGLRGLAEGLQQAAEEFGRHRFQ